MVVACHSLSRMPAFCNNALSRRIVEEGTDERHLYYSPAWQVLEERISDMPVTQYVWSPVYIDAMILRDRSVSGELDERIWVTHDANFNVTMLMDVYGDVVERLTYTPFGVATVHEDGYAVKDGSDFVWQYRHQGGRWSAESGLIYSRGSIRSAIIGRWADSNSIIFSRGEENIYLLYSNNPVRHVDAFGFAAASFSADVVQTRPPNVKAIPLPDGGHQDVVIPPNQGLVPPNPPPGWGGPGNSRGNCYRFACDSKCPGTDRNDKDHSRFPGGSKQSPYSPDANTPPFDCKKLKEGALKDGLKEPDANGKCPAGTTRVAYAYGAIRTVLVYDPATRQMVSRVLWDHHWWREYPNGTWCHKRGSTEAMCKDADGKVITDPSKQNGAYTMFCGYLCMPDDKKLPNSAN